MDEADKKLMGSTLKDDGPNGSISAAQLVVYTEVGEDDVILGRGKRSYNHRGNINFRKLVHDRALAYKQRNKAYRRALAQDIIKTVRRNGGKFLRPIEPPFGSGEEPSRWQAVPASMAVTKVKQALRDMSSRISDDQHSERRPTAAAASQQSPRPAATHSILPSMVQRMNPQSAILPPFHSQLPAVGMCHPLLMNLPIGQDTEYHSLLGQLATLEQNIRQRQETERILQQLQVLDQQVPARLPSGLSLPHQEALLRQLNYVPTPNQRAQTSTQDLIRELNNRHSLALLDTERLATMPPPHHRDMSVLAQQQLADTALLSGLNPLQPHQLGAAVPARQHDGLLGGMNTSIPANLADQRVSLGGHFPVWRGNDHNLSRGLSPIPATALTMQNALVPAASRDDLELPLLDDHAGGMVPPSNNGPPHHDNTFMMFGNDDNANNESAPPGADDMLSNNLRH